MLPSRPLTIELSIAAELDFTDILQFTEEHFGVDQKERYAEWLDEALQRIAANPQLGKAVRHPGYFRHHIATRGKPGRHYIYYTVVGKTLFVARILHDRMKYTRHPPFDH